MSIDASAEGKQEPRAGAAGTAPQTAPALPTEASLPVEGGTSALAPVAPVKPPPMVWIDVETTGLSQEWDLLLEVAVVVTDNDLDPHAAYTAVVHHLELPTVHEIVWKMHGENGLFNEVREGGKTLAEISGDICSLLASQGVTGRSPLCGSTVHFDRGFIRRDLPVVEKMLHYRNVDVSSLRELVMRWRPEIEWKKKDAHRALPDIYESIKELQHYRKAFGL